MTLDEAFHAAAQLLQERGQLLNGHLLRLVDGDKQLFDDVRRRLIQEGVAEDRSSVGLAVKESSPRFRSASMTGPGSQAPAVQSPPSGWWLMTAGATRGPLDLAELCEMRRRSEIKISDVVRHGTEGMWQRLDAIPELAASLPEEANDGNSLRIRDRQRAEFELYKSNWGGGHRAFSGNTKVQVGEASTAASASASGTADVTSLGSAVPIADQDTDPNRNSIDDRRFAPSARMWSIDDHKPPGWLKRSWNLMADLAGGSRRLTVILISFIAVGSFTYWWLQPPSSRTVYNEFTECRAAILKLQDRRAKRSDFSPVIDRYRPRVQYIVDRLRFRTSNPVQNELYLAGSQGLLPLIDNPLNPVTAERLFAQHMEAAQRLLDRTQASSAKVDAPK